MIWIALIGWALFGLMVAEYLWKTKHLKQLVKDYTEDAMYYYKQRRELEVQIYGHEYVHGALGNDTHSPKRNRDQAPGRFVE